ncbi:MAG: pyridine nucleotide-disulfide oxidoreductase [Betaproteobacteria bacterium CG2_30_68_42]|nr:MAG: pyridine nucleotide-disulfide oxidoreductase [Betaproteobacteria bacterium CG2_30_68_42]PJA56333.1 MAG: pyridine nucleotide-disulfide oxidoreductase [Rhodocyclales bacterium CG_4_9_14_3_um_filter_68_10]
MKRLLLILVAGALVAAFFALGLDQALTLDGLKAGLARFSVWRAASPVAVGFAFFALYVAVTAFSLPGAAVMTLAAGALFGLGWGTLIVSFASSIGATAAFLVARYLLRDVIQARFGDRLATIDAGIQREGASYLFALRLVPLFPFFVINALMGLTRMPMTTFYWVSQAGMLAGTLVYVNAGTQLAGLRALSGIVSPGVLLSFALLGIFPLIAKRALAWRRRRRVYARWKRPQRFERNLVVIGGGAAGLVAAYVGAAVKARVTLIEARWMGGDCLNTGCVPSKALIRCARLVHRLREAGRFGIEIPSVRVRFREVMARVQEVIATVAPHDSAERYRRLGVEVVHGHARIVDPWTVEVTAAEGGTRRLTTRAIVIAAGARPFVPPLPGIEDAGVLTSDTLWEAFAKLDAPPERLVVLGGGPIGCELAQAMAQLGSGVILVEMAPRVLLREDEEVARCARASLERDGVDVLAGHKAVRCEREDGRKFLVVEHDGAERRIEFDALLCAVGRAARLSGFGLEELGIPASRTVTTNEYLETLYPNIYAAGDVAGPYQFTHAAAHQAWYAAVNALFGDFKRFRVDYAALPSTTFIDPEVARVGLNEQEAREQGIAVEVTRYGLEDLDRAIADGVTQGFVKVLTVPGKDRILGVTLVGEHAGELIAEFVLAMKHGLGLNRILATIHSYPTLAEANKYAAGEWKRAHAPQRVLRWLERYHAWRRG